MNRTSRLLLIAVSAASYALVADSACRADLFALGTNVGEVYRIDSVSGQVTRTYNIPTGPTGITPLSGMAFDGRTLYFTIGTPAVPFVEIARFDVVNEVWLEPAILDPIFLFPPDAFGGLGFIREGGRELLIGATWNQPFPGEPIDVFQYEVFDSFPAPSPFVSHQFAAPNMGFQYHGVGLDVDRESGEIWMATREVVEPGTIAEHSLVQIDLQGNVLATLPLELEPPFRPVRGVGFDNGQLFVADVLRSIYEIDRSDGSIIRSFTLPVEGIIGALTGGDVVPEPSAAWLFILPALPALLRQH